ncbi:METTL5 family protein [Halanaeroarchaeum sulfurireducens]|uniref:RNA methylase n=1 Tax=Halanaeroarchaeum sulfurireducens TaxID=1604004 RepID=A0A0F7PAP6_9EURY|nr:METTL5 family protein [Halanaeroarchaeum sulfurireducens]AKH97812.1 RNA methylase [Halanaeroarchaeum sulfurireducens]ALG82206.1 RNA methylase [Halanaeroarchaeum sulfurireducens]
MKRELARRLESVDGFTDPSPDLEQYRTPADLAAHVIHVAALQGDIEDRTVVDLGTGTGMLALGAAFAGPSAVVGVEVDPGALVRARGNEGQLAPPVPVDWVRGDAMRSPLDIEDATVMMNPPFGAQAGNRHADRAFLGTAATIGAVSYSIHNEGSRPFVEGFAADNGGEVTHAFRADFEVPHQFAFHRDETRTLETEVFRIEWERPAGAHS